MKIRITNITVNDSKRERAFNDTLMIRSAMKNNPEKDYVCEDDWTFTGSGARDVKGILKWRGLAFSDLLDLEIESEHVQNRYDALTLADVASHMPACASASLTIEMRDGSKVSTLVFTMVKEGGTDFHVRKNVVVF